MLPKHLMTVTGHPVDVASGTFFTDEEDFFLTGVIPLSWERTWYSRSDYKGALGKVGKKKFKFTPTLFAPTSFSIPIPTGAPVMVSGPYVPDWGGMLTGLLSSIGFSTLLSFAPAILKAMKKAGKKGGNLSKAYATKARRLMSGIVDKTPLPRRKKTN